MEKKFKAVFDPPIRENPTAGDILNAWDFTETDLNGLSNALDAAAVQELCKRKRDQIKDQLHKGLEFLLQDQELPQHIIDDILLRYDQYVERILKGKKVAE